MVPDNQLGDWLEEPGCVIRFSPPPETPQKKKCK
jgi:hypothetical protein